MVCVLRVLLQVSMLAAFANSKVSENTLLGKYFMKTNDLLESINPIQEESFVLSIVKELVQSESYCLILFTYYDILNYTDYINIYIFNTFLINL